MTTYTTFTPSATANFQFQPTLDGNTYTAIVTWNVAAQRYYINLYDLSNTRILTIAMVASPVGFDISLVAGLFASKLVWRAVNGQFEVSP